MKTLAVNNPMKTLTLAIASAVAGLLVGMALLAPISALADPDNDGPPPVQAELRTFTLVDNNGVPSTFTLVNNSGHFVLTLVPVAVQPSSTDDDSGSDD